jgi:hypothetical protein
MAPNFIAFPDLGLLLCAQIDALGIATALEVEHALVAPTVLVVADQLAVGVCAQGGLARTAEAEEHGGITVLTDVGAAMHAEHATLLGQHVVQHGEDALLDLAGVACATDQDHLLGEVDDGEVVLAGAIQLGSARKPGALMMCHSGSKLSSSAMVGRRNMLPANWALQGYSATTRMFSV